MAFTVSSETGSDLRWDPYLMRSGPRFHSFWRDHLSEERSLFFILGRGFDPRMCDGLEAVLNVGDTATIDCLFINFDEGPSSPSRQHEDMVEANIKKLHSLLEGRGKLSSKPLAMWSGKDHRRRRTGARNAAALLEQEDLKGYTDIVVDTSALPRSLYLPLIGKLMYLVDEDLEESNESTEGLDAKNLHVITAANPKLDSKIEEVGPDEDASYISPFSGKMELESQKGIPKIWIPILGESQLHQLRRIYDYVSPEEVTPMLPFPSQDPRRGDDLIEEYRGLLFDEWRIEPRNIVYASEHNPFQVYRAIMSTVSLYRKALSPLGGCRAAVSALSSKLLSIGALLAAYDSKTNGSGTEIAIAHVESQGYAFSEDSGAKKETRLCTLWLAGECYLI